MGQGLLAAFTRKNKPPTMQDLGRVAAEIGASEQAQKDSIFTIEALADVLAGTGKQVKQDAPAMSAPIKKTFDTTRSLRKEAPELQTYAKDLDSWKVKAKKQLDDYYNKLSAAGYDATEIEASKKQAYGDLESKYSTALKGSAEDSKNFIKQNQALLSPQERNQAIAGVKDIAGEKKTFSENLAQIPLAGALENLQTSGEQAGYGAIKESGGILSSPQAAIEEARKNEARIIKPAQDLANANIPLLSDYARFALKQGLTNQRNMLGAMEQGAKPVSSIGQKIYDFADQKATTGDTGKRKEFNPIAAGIGEFAGAAAPYAALEVATGGGATGTLATPFAKQALGFIKNPILRRIAGNGLVAGAENTALEAVINPGRQLQSTGEFDSGQYAKDLLVAAGAGTVFGGGAEAFSQGIGAARRASRGAKRGTKIEPEAVEPEGVSPQAQIVNDLKSQLGEVRSSIQERLTDVNGERALLSERGQKRLKKLEDREKELSIAIQKYEPTAKETTVQGLGAKQKAQEIASRLKSKNSQMGSSEQSVSVPSQSTNTLEGYKQTGRSPLPKNESPVLKKDQLNQEIKEQEGTLLSNKEYLPEDPLGVVNPISKTQENVISQRTSVIDNTDNINPKDFSGSQKENFQDPKLGSKKVTGTDGKKRIAKTLGDYKAVDFQELARNPKRLEPLKAKKPVQERVSKIGELAKQKKTLETSLVDLAEALEKKLQQTGIKPEEFEYKGIRLFPKKGKEGRALNTKGQKILDRYERMLDRLGLAERRALSDTPSLVAQTNLPKSSLAKTGVQNSIEDLAEQIIRAKGDLPKVEKAFTEAKSDFLKNTPLDVDTVFRNEAGDVAFHVRRGSSKLVGEAEELYKARRKQLQERLDTGRITKAEYSIGLKDAETEKTINIANKKFKQAYQEVKDAETLIKDGDASPEVIEEATEGLGKVNKSFGVELGFVPLVTALAKQIAEGNGIADTIELALNVFPVRNIGKNAQFKKYKDAALDLIFSTPKNLDQELAKIKVPKNEKFLEGLQRLEARKLLYEAEMARKNSEIFKEVQDILDKKSIDQVLDAEGRVRPEFENSKAAEVLEEMADRKRELVEHIEDYKDEVLEKVNTLQKQIERQNSDTISGKKLLKKLKAEKYEYDKLLINLDNRLGAMKTVMSNPLISGIQSAAYKAALLWNPSSAFLNLFDYLNLRATPELQSSKGIARLKNAVPFLADVDQALIETITRKLFNQKGSILESLGADKRGSYWNVMSTASRAKKNGLNVGDWVRQVEDFDPNKVISDFYHDVALVASAKAWKADNPKFKNLPDPVKNFAEFTKLAPLEAKTSFATKLGVDLGLVAGRGFSGTDFTMGGFANNELGKSYLSFFKPIYRVTNNLSRATIDLMDGLNGFKKQDNGTFVWDWTKTDNDKALRGLSSLVANVGGLYLTGGATALVGTPLYGSLMNMLIKTLVPEDQRDEWKENFNKYSLANKKLLPGLGERLQLQQRELGEKDSVLGLISNRIKSLGHPVMGDYITNVSKAMDMTVKMAEEGEFDYDKLRKAYARLFLLQIVNKMIDYFSENEKKIYDTKGMIPRELGSVPTRGDLKLAVGAGNEAIENIKQSDKLKQRAKEQLSKVEFEKKGKALRPTFTREGYKRYKEDVDKYMKLNPDMDRNEVETKLLQAAKKKWLEKHPDMKAKEKPRKYKPVNYSIRET